MSAFKCVTCHRLVTLIILPDIETLMTVFVTQQRLIIMVSKDAIEREMWDDDSIPGYGECVWQHVWGKWARMYSYVCRWVCMYGMSVTFWGGGGKPWWPTSYHLLGNSIFEITPKRNMNSSTHQQLKTEKHWNYTDLWLCPSENIQYVRVSVGGCVCITPPVALKSN